MNNEKWIIGLDLDGTVTTDFNPKIGKSYPHPYNVKVIKRLQELGHEVVIVTGRNWVMSKEVYDECELTSPIINSAGGHTWNPSDSSFDQDIHLMKKEIINEIMNDPQVINKINFLLFDERDKSYIYESNGNEEIEFKIGRWGEGNIIPIEKPFTNMDVESLIIYLNINDDEYPEFSKYMKNKYGSTVDVSDWGKKNKGYYSFEFNTNEIDKGIAFNSLSDKLGIPMERRLVIGDGPNDMKLIQSVENSVCMKNGNDEVKSKSKYITELDNNNGGAGDFLNKFFNLDLERDD